MTYRLPESLISNFLTHHTRPLRLSTLPPSTDPSCPICHIPYAPLDTRTCHPLILPDTLEYPVQIRNCGLCRHIFGRRCVEAHIRARQPWSHTCPLCRAEWFPAPNAGRREAVGDLESALDGLARIERGDMDEGVRREVERVERALGRIREVLYGPRWI